MVRRERMQETSRVQTLCKAEPGRMGLYAHPVPEELPVIHWVQATGTIIARKAVYLPYSSFKSNEIYEVSVVTTKPLKMDIRRK